MEINGVAHIFVTAGDFERSKAFYMQLLPFLGRVAPYLFGIALLCAGQSSTLTGTLAGQIVMEGYLHLRITPWLRRLATRMLALVPAVVVIALAGEGSMQQRLFQSLECSQLVLVQ